jgi:hypothetical protein
MTLQEQRDVLARFIAYRNGNLSLLNQEADDLLDLMHLVYPMALKCMDKVLATPKPEQHKSVTKRLKAQKDSNDE